MQDDDDADPEERDPSGRFARYGQRVGKGRFKCVYKAFDEKQGIDVAWSKVLQARYRSCCSFCDLLGSFSEVVSTGHPYPPSGGCQSKGKPDRIVSTVPIPGHESLHG